MPDGLRMGRRPGGHSPVRRLRWVAMPPPGTQRESRTPPAAPYTGPPCYPAPPRWGFPSLTWRRPTMVPGTPSAAADPLLRQRALGRQVLAVLGATALLAAMAAAAEFWRYALLVRSRSSALDSGVVLSSDALVLAADLMTFVVGAFAVGTAFWWLLLARAAAARRTGWAPARDTRRVAVAVFLPVLNLVLAGPVVAELEHQALGRAPEHRPQPSRLVLAWWIAWVVNGVLALVTIGWRMREGVQAQADSVLLTGCTDLAACVLAVLTGLVIHRIMALLGPLEPGRRRRMRVIGVRGAPEPPLRPLRPSGSAR
ncbi:MAG: DUF4328 domain-containing protein [Haloechinothrix sp.]